MTPEIAPARMYFMKMGFEEIAALSEITDGMGMLVLSPTLDCSLVPGEDRGNPEVLI